jgi:hypothetical protein
MPSASRLRTKSVREMAPRPQHPPGPPMTLRNMRELGVHHLIDYCLNGSTEKGPRGHPRVAFTRAQAG